MSEGFVPLDLTKADVIPDGTYVATVIQAELKGTKDGTSQYINWLLHIPEHTFNIFYITSFKAPRMVKAMLDACGIPYDTEGFKYIDCMGKQIQVTVGTKDDPEYGLQNRITKVSKA